MVAGSRRPCKIRKPTAIQSVSDWVAEQDIINPVVTDDKEVTRFRDAIGTIFYRLREETLTNPHYSTCQREDKAIAYSLFRPRKACKPSFFVDLVLAGMSRKTQQILCKENLERADLLDLLFSVEMYKHRMLYFNLPTKFNPGDITQGIAILSL